MNEIKGSIEIDAPVEKVFGYISDYRNWQEFYAGISDVRPVTEKTAETGSKFIYKTRTGGMTFTVGTEFRDFVENEGWTGEVFKGVKHQTKWKVCQKNGKTEFTHVVRYSLPFYMGGKLLDVLMMKPGFEKTVQRSLENVKEKMEAD